MGDLIDINKNKEEELLEELVHLIILHKQIEERIEQISKILGYATI